MAFQSISYSGSTMEYSRVSVLAYRGSLADVSRLHGGADTDAALGGGVLQRIRPEIRDGASGQESYRNKGQRPSEFNAACCAGCSPVILMLYMRRRIFLPALAAIGSAEHRPRAPKRERGA